MLKRIFEQVKPILNSILAGLVGLAVGAIIMAIWGYAPLEAYDALFSAIFGSFYGLSSTLARATPLILT